MGVASSWLRFGLKGRGMDFFFVERTSGFSGFGADSDSARPSSDLISPSSGSSAASEVVWSCPSAHGSSSSSGSRFTCIADLLASAS